MRPNLLTRDQTAAIVGAAIVDRLDGENCEPTCLVGYNGASAGDPCTEWAASAVLADGTVVRAYYYTTAADLDDAGDDLSAIDWRIAGYDVV
ncbi:hypothetical protein UFOVP254_52 [uncultured Caudovirales phage]|uniref:Uncharacterized protein n=1 Tax=uncultured Caudovirales phage TaxID=2100421 RepID=A0A6J5L051_9CAUD|nr:hypothetical protein UFOVP76_1 [uncultured Caudovirales phage]CAB4133133.1 hypothetical protein UFOVP254_52 [uncultured Caudovirales phage]